MHATLTMLRTCFEGTMYMKGFWIKQVKINDKLKIELNSNINKVFGNKLMSIRVKTINLESILVLYSLRNIDLLQNKDNVYDSYKLIIPK